ncbi:HAMP domain-containing sensor histidine kinase [Microbacterium sp. 13-71-7]|uniref:sensor histidine kinase n=1 Tax=Microbacterium sp. 13-71-7 TaxID=1970399 RepID=UPI0025E0A03A|nr:HAMP domain-containing sensor histidine kinase [Microbacterium sp. 13-71-7]
METQAEFRRSSRAIGWQVAAVCAALVLLGAGLALAYMFWQTRPAEVNGPPEPGSVRVFLDPADLVLGGIVVGLGAIVCAGAAAWLIARRAVRPLEEAARIQQRFVADASHELRTPLAVLNARLQQLALLTPADDSRREIVGALREDAGIMSGIVDDMLAAATGAAPQRGRCALGEVMTAAAADMALLAEGRRVRISTSPLAREVALPAADLRRCLVALIDNAIDHAPAGSTVSVTAVAERAAARIAVADGGSGITGIDPARVFDRFAHGSPAGGRPPGGAGGGSGHGSGGGAADGSGSRTRFGIGLALVAELAERHGGAVRVARTGPEGTVFELVVPFADGGADR